MPTATWPNLLGRLLDIEDLQSVESLRPSFAAPWANGAPAWVFFGCAALVLVAVGCYGRMRRPGSRWARLLLGMVRGAVFAVLLVCLAEPVLTVQLVKTTKPLVWLLFDGTDSMAIEEEGQAPKTRQERVKASLTGAGGWVARLAVKHRLKAFLFDRPDGVRALEVRPEVAAGGLGAAIARQLTTAGEVTALGAAFEDLARRQNSSALAALIVCSDFAQNAGPPAVARARQLGVPVYTLGVGAVAPVDLAIDLQAPLVMKKAERSQVRIALRQSGLDGRAALVRLSAIPAAADGSAASTSSSSTINIGERTIELKEPSMAFEMPFVPAATGRFTFRAEVELPAAEAGAEEAVAENNRAEREVTIRDDFLRVSFVEYEPTWEWRFIKEVFHRDPLVGRRGFRTFLRSADARVRQSNELFLPTLTPPRGEFFVTDVLFLGDFPAAALSTRFCELTREFVGKFGGGLVILSGPRFGPAELANTPLADLLPIVPDPTARRRDGEFRLRLAPAVEQPDFMRLGDTAGESLKAWENLGPLPWYQPVARLHSLGVLLAGHPQDLCVDGKTPQPMIAMRRHGAGEVVYLAFNETWRLRRKHGELYYRQFWGQMIHRLGLSHALGAQKRFVIRTDREQYRAGESAIVTVEAYDASFEPLGAESLPERQLIGELQVSSRAASEPRTVHLHLLRDGVFEARVALAESGEHRLRVLDPVTNAPSEVVFQVTSVSAERRSAQRHQALEDELAEATGGKAHDLAAANRLADELRLPDRQEREVRVLPLWSNWLVFGLVVGLLLLEWSVRKATSLP